MKRVREWVQARIDDAVRRRMPDPEALMINAIRGIDRKDLAWHVDTPEFRKNVAQLVKEGNDFLHELSALTASCDDLRAAVSRQVADRVIDQIDLGDIAGKTAEMISAEDVAYHMDAEDVAGYVEVDADTIAEKVAEDIDVSECVDYDKLAEALVSKLKEAWA